MHACLQIQLGELGTGQSQKDEIVPEESFSQVHDSQRTDTNRVALDPALKANIVSYCGVLMRHVSDLTELSCYKIVVRRSTIVSTRKLRIFALS